MTSISPFQAWTRNWHDYLYAEFPQAASADGIHGQDEQLGGYDSEQIHRVAGELKRTREQLRRDILPRVTPEEVQDAAIAETALERWIWNVECYRRWERDPQYYGELLCSAWLTHVLFPWSEPEERLRVLTCLVRQTSQVLEHARCNLDGVPSIFARYGLETFRGMLSLLRRDLPLAFKQVNDQALLSEFRTVAEDAAGEVERFLAFLEELPATQPGADFALGREPFIAMLRKGEQVESDPEFLAELAEQEIERCHRRWQQLAKKLDATRSPEQVWHRLHQEHPEGGTLPQSAASQLEQLKAFLAEQNLVPVPERLQIQVLPTPEFFRWSFASIWNPGPFESVPMKSTYYITDVLPEWTAEQKEQHLATYSYGNLWMVTIHEVFPGHGVQLAWLPDVAKNIRKSRLTGCTAYIEGWAHYAEELMVEAGFRGDDARIEAGQIAEALTRLCRTVAAIRMHLGQMTLDEAARLFVEKGWSSEQSGRREAERGTFDPEYCLYTIGKWQLQGLRHLALMEDASFSLIDFHARILQGGIAPWSIYKQELLQDAVARGQDLVEVFAREVADTAPARSRWE